MNKKEIDTFFESYIHNEGKKLFEDKIFTQLSIDLTNQIFSRGILPKYLKGRMKQKMQFIFMDALKNYGV